MNRIKLGKYCATVLNMGNTKQRGLIGVGKRDFRFGKTLFYALAQPLFSINNIAKRFCLLLAGLLSMTSVFGQALTNRAEVTIYYRFDKANLDASYLTNAESLRALDQMVEKYAESIDSVTIIAHSSPEGNMPYNQRLSERRSATMKNYLETTYPTVAFNKIIVNPRGADFDGLLRMVEADSKVPYKNDVMKVLLSSGNKDRMFLRLTKIRGGEPYAYIRRNILPYLRSATTCIFYCNAPVSTGEQQAVATTEPTSSAAQQSPKNYNYNITTEKVYTINADGQKTAVEGLSYYTVTVNEQNEGVVGEYKLVAPNGTTNLSGKYSLTATPSTHNQAESGYVAEDGSICSTYVVVDGENAAMTSGEVEIEQREDGTMDVVTKDAVLVYGDGRSEQRTVEHRNCKGDVTALSAEPIFSNNLTYVVTASDIEELSGVSCYTVTVSDEESGVVGEYLIVAPNGTTNLSGWYSLTPTPTQSSQSISGSFDAEGNLSGSSVVIDGRSYSLAEGTVDLRQSADGEMNIVCDNAVTGSADGKMQRRRIEMRNVKGNGVPFVEKDKSQQLWIEETTPATDNTVTYTVNAKTNLLFDAIAAVNVGVEIPFGKRFSLDASWTFPWYLPKNWSWCYQLLWGDVEGRYWLGNRDARGLMKGHFCGLYAGGGLYDFQPGNNDGYQGEFFIAAGLSYGYCMPISKRLNLEFELGIGFLQTNYRHYYHIVDTDGSNKLIRDRLTGKFSYWGPTKAKVTLVMPIQWSVNKNKTK